MNMKYAMTEHPSPVSDADLPTTFGLHTGFSLYLTRQRKDNGRTKLDEIFSNVERIGRELAPDGDYELSLAGHSLGGALATITGFYAAAAAILSKVTSIRVFTYAAPRVGCQKWRLLFQHLERTRRLRLARFSNAGDLVPLVPFWRYKHVGVHIRLHGIGKSTQLWLRLKVTLGLSRVGKSVVS